MKIKINNKKTQKISINKASKSKKNNLKNHPKPEHKNKVKKYHHPERSKSNPHRTITQSLHSIQNHQNLKTKIITKKMTNKHRQN
jgi:hypothetical protein